jgi:ribosomal protein S27AE
MIHKTKMCPQCSDLMDWDSYFQQYRCTTCGYMEVEINSGLTEQEQKVIDNLISAWNEYNQLEKQHPDDIDIFQDGIHKCQQILAMRILRREYPDYWVKKE